MQNKKGKRKRNYDKKEIEMSMFNNDVEDWASV